MHVISTAKNPQTYLMYGVIGLFGALLFLAGAYALLVNKTVLNVVAWEKTEDQIVALNTTVGDMEFKQMSLRNTITLGLAHSLGFSDASDITFIARNETSPTGLSLSH